MKRDDSSEMEHDVRPEGLSHALSASSHISPAGTKPLPAFLARWSHAGRSNTAGNRSVPLSIHVDDAALDDKCHATLRKLVAAGCTNANRYYSLEQFQIAEQELRYLKQHGFVHAEASALLHPVILSYERQKAGADVGKISIVLNVNLHGLPSSHKRQE